MSSFSSLYIGVSALTTAQRSVEVAAHNVANANTAGYTRQRLLTGTAMPTPGTLGLRGDGQRGMGVTVIGVERLRDRLSDASWRVQSAVSGSATARSQVLDRVQSVVGPYGDGLPQALSRFYSAWDALSLSPADPAARSTVIAAGAGLADGLRSASQGLDAVQSEVGQRLVDSGSEVNGLLQHVARLNLAIQDAEIDLSSPNDLRDERDNALDRLAALTGAQVERRDDGMVDVRLGDVLLVEGGTSTPMEVDPDGDPAVWPADGLSGAMGGLVRTRSVDIPAHRERLDALAGFVIGAVNDVHQGSTGLDGVSGRAFFAGSSAADIDLDPGLDATTLAASASGAAADGDGAIAMGSLRTARVADGATLTEAFRAFGSTVGQAAADAARSAKTASSALDGASLTRSSLNGVNVDEEMVDLVKYQHAYSAASRVITVIDEMLDKIINQTGR